MEPRAPRDSSFPAVEVRARAKLNWYLRVLGRRDDGYHDLETVMSTVSLFDTLTFQPLNDSQLRLTMTVLNGDSPASVAAIPLDDRNLVCRAARLLQDVAGCRLGAAIHLVKRIPSQAGMGGGSSNAAATLIGLNRLWNLQWPASELVALASRLGSDVPFFASGHRSAICRGRGEAIEPLTAKSRPAVVLIKPPEGLSTADVYRAWRPRQLTAPLDAFLSAWLAGDGARAASRLLNDLQPAAESIGTSTARLAEWFSHQSPWGHQLTGSGSAYFGVFPHFDRASVVARRLAARNWGRVWVLRANV